MYEVYLERAAERDLKRLSAEDFHCVIHHIENLAEEPSPSGCRNIISSKSDWRIWIGSYRSEN